MLRYCLVIRIIRFKKLKKTNYLISMYYEKNKKVITANIVYLNVKRKPPRFMKSFCVSSKLTSFLLIA